MGTVPIPSDATIDEATAPQSDTVPIPTDATIADETSQEQQSRIGEVTTPEGVKVIVPKEGESFAQTMQRAAAYGKTVTPEQISAEMKTAPKKAAEALGAAPVIGAGGAAALAGSMEAVPSVLAHTTEGVKAIGDWASKNPMQAYLLYQVIKEFIPGAKKAIGFIKGSPDVPQPPAP